MLDAKLLNVLKTVEDALEAAKLSEADRVRVLVAALRRCDPEAPPSPIRRVKTWAEYLKEVEARDDLDNEG